MPGRGGAGNILAVQQENERVAADLEANQSAAESYAQPTPIRNEPQYAHSGRGGAGNFYSPKELSQKGQYKDTDLSQVGDGTKDSGLATTDPFSNAKPLSGPTRTYGRGGVGNYSYDASENQEKALRKKMEEDEDKQQKLKADIEAGVKETLAMPPKAKLPGEQPY